MHTVLSSTYGLSTRYPERFSKELGSCISLSYVSLVRQGLNPSGHFVVRNEALLKVIKLSKDLLPQILLPFGIVDIINGAIAEPVVHPDYV